MPSETAENAVSWFEELNTDDVSRVGGKNASLGEMIRMLKHEGIRVPDGFATTTEAYRNEKRFDYMRLALSVGVQKKVCADKAGAGVMFTLDTGTGVRDVVVINAAWGWGKPFQ